MAWDSIEDLWWLKPGQEQVPPLQALQAGAQIAQNKARLELQAQETANQAVRTNIDVDEHRNKLMVQNKIAAGMAELSGVLATIDDYSDPSARMRIFDVAKRNPYVMSSPAWAGIQTMFSNTEKLMNQIEIQRMKDDTTRYKIDLASQDLGRRLDILQQRADTYAEGTEARTQYHNALQAYREANAAQTHEERARKLFIAEHMASLAEQRLQLDTDKERRLAAEAKARTTHLENRLSDADRIGMAQELRVLHDIFLAVPRKNEDEWNLATQEYRAKVGNIVRKYENKVRGQPLPGTIGPPAPTPLSPPPGAIAPSPALAPTPGVRRFNPLTRRAEVVPVPGLQPGEEPPQ